MSTCSFCGANAELVPTVGLVVCPRCASGIGRLARETPAAFWLIEGPQPKPTAGGDPAFGTMLRAFQRGVAERISTEDSESHYHLAHAYRAMGLYADAITAAGTALATEVTPSTSQSAESALGILLTAPLLREGGLESLRGQLGDP